MPSRVALLFLSSISLLCLLPDLALAACTSPAGVKGEIIYNDDHSVLQFCDDTNWIGMSGGAGGSGGGSLTDGDKGDVTVSGSGAVWSVDSGSVTYAKIQNISAAGILLGRATTGAGVVEEITLGSGLTLTGTTLSATGSSSGTAGYIQFSGGSGTFASSSTTAGQQFFWDETNHRLGVGIAAPTQAIDVVGKITSDSLLMKKVAAIPAPVGGSGTWTTDGTHVWRATGNVGIGTASPSAALHVVGAANAWTGRVASSTTSGQAYGLLVLGGTTSADKAFSVYDATGATQYFGVRGDGNVGIGTTTPGSPLDVRSAAGENVVHVGDDGQTDGGDTYGAVNIVKGATTGWTAGGGQRAHLSFIRSGNRVFKMGYVLNSNTMLLGDTSGGGIAIDTVGNVGIGTTTPTYKLEVNGTTRFYTTANAHKVVVENYGNGFGYGMVFHPVNDTSTTAIQFQNAAGTGVGGVSTNASATTYATSSDYRLKENMVPLSGALERLANLKPAKFNFKSEPGKTVDGFIAHEVQEVAPYAVTGQKNAVDEQGKPLYQAVDYGRITPLLVAAIQEQQKQLEALETEIEAQGREIEALKAAR